MYSKQRVDRQRDTFRLNETAAKLIKSYVKAMVLSKDKYPSSNEISDEKAITFITVSFVFARFRNTKM